MSSFNLGFVVSLKQLLWGNDLGGEEVLKNL